MSFNNTKFAPAVQRHVRVDVGIPLVLVLVGTDAAKRICILGLALVVENAV